MKLALAAPLLLFLFVPALVGAPAGAVAVAPRAAPVEALFSWVPAGGFPNRFPFGQCTWWAAYNRRVTWGGNARDWLVNASALGVPTSDEPSLGAVVVYWPGGKYSPLGHVALVVAVAPSMYTVSEMNAAAGWGRVDTRVIRWPDPDVQGFIPPTAEEMR
jgi:surface antigen